MQLKYAMHVGVFIWPTLQVTYLRWSRFNTKGIVEDDMEDELQICLWWIRRGLIISWSFKPE